MKARVERSEAIDAEREKRYTSLALVTGMTVERLKELNQQLSGINRIGQE